MLILKASPDEDAEQGDSHSHSLSYSVKASNREYLLVQRYLGQGRKPNRSNQTLDVNTEHRVPSMEGMMGKLQQGQDLQASKALLRCSRTLNGFKRGLRFERV
jgi:hypothetical protein